MNKNEIDLVYKIPNGESKIKIFGNEFVEVNKKLCKIIYKDKELDLSSKFDCGSITDDILKIKLKGINNVSNLNSIF